jgi:hypothetical protein
MPFQQNANGASQKNYIYRMGTAPNTRAAVSQKNKIYSYSVAAKQFVQLGAISEFGFDESRGVDPVRGVGYGDQIAELVPGVTEPMTLTVNKTLLYTANLFQIFGYKGGIDGLARSLRHHRWPFDIKQELVFSELASSKDDQGATQQASVQPGAGDYLLDVPVQCLLTIFEGCWMNSYSASFTSDAAIVAENSSVTVTDVIDGTSLYGEFIDTGLAPVSNVGTAGAGWSFRFANNSNTNAQV